VPNSQKGKKYVYLKVRNDYYCCKLGTELAFKKSFLKYLLACVPQQLAVFTGMIMKKM